MDRAGMLTVPKPESTNISSKFAILRGELTDEVDLLLDQNFMENILGMIERDLGWGRLASSVGHIRRMIPSNFPAPQHIARQVSGNRQ